MIAPADTLGIAENCPPYKKNKRAESGDGLCFLGGDDSSDRCNLPAIQSNTPPALSSRLPGSLWYRRFPRTSRFNHRRMETNQHSSQHFCGMFDSCLMQTSVCLACAVCHTHCKLWPGEKKNLRAFVLFSLPSSSSHWCVLQLSFPEIIIQQNSMSILLGWLSAHAKHFYLFWRN